MTTPILSINTSGTVARVARELAATPAAIERARTRALRKLATWVQRQVLKAAAEAAGTTQKVIKVLLRFRVTRHGDGAIRIWLGTNPLSAHHLGTVRWTRRMQGARAGRRLFPGSWSWSAPAKTAGLIMERAGPPRLPIRKVTVAIHDTVSNRLQSLIPAIADRFERLFVQELHYALNLERTA